MRACILAAGVGSRLGSLTADRPKALIEVGGKSFLTRMVEQLVAVGVRELIVATGYRADAIARALSDAPVAVVLRNNDAYDRTQNSASLRLCRDAWLDGGAQDTFKLDGDLLFHPEILRRLLVVRAQTRADLVVAVDRRQPLGVEEMKVTLAGEEITAFGKHLDPATADGESIGIELVAASAIEPLFAALDAEHAAGRDSLYYEDVYDRLLRARGGPLLSRAATVTDLPWAEVDTPDDLRAAALLLPKLR